VAARLSPLVARYFVMSIHLGGALHLHLRRRRTEVGGVERGQILHAAALYHVQFGPEMEDAVESSRT
jgi:hypothetical protein